MLRRPPRFTLFTYSTIFRSACIVASVSDRATRYGMILLDGGPSILRSRGEPIVFRSPEETVEYARIQDRKITRLNSSHLGISYAVFCLKKKKKKKYNGSAKL